MMGADYYEKDVSTIAAGIPLGIGSHSHIEGAIVDKNARIGERVTIKPFPRGYREESENWVIEDGIVVIPKNTVLHPGTTIAPS